MSTATKVSVRADGQGVLSLQFLVNVDEEEKERVAFVDFRIVPLIDAEDGGSSDGE